MLNRFMREFFVSKQIDCEKRQRDPDENETDPLKRGRLFAQDEDAAQKLTGRTQVVEQSERRQFDSNSRGAEELQRNRRQRARADKETEEIRVGRPKRRRFRSQDFLDDIRRADGEREERFDA